MVSIGFEEGLGAFHKWRHRFWVQEGGSESDIKWLLGRMGGKEIKVTVCLVENGHCSAGANFLSQITPVETCRRQKTHSKKRSSVLDTHTHTHTHTHTDSIAHTYTLIQSLTHSHSHSQTRPRERDFISLMVKCKLGKLNHPTFLSDESKLGRHPPPPKKDFLWSCPGAKKNGKILSVGLVG